MKSKDIEGVRSPHEDSCASNEQLALKAFLGFIKRQERETRAVRVAKALAEDCLQRLADGKKLAMYNSIQVTEMATDGVVPEKPTAWLAKVWDDLEKRLNQWELGLQDTARQAGSAIYARPRKSQGAGGAGNSSSFGLVFLPVPETETDQPASAPGSITYFRDLTLKPAFWIKPLVHAGFALKGWRRAAFVTYGLGGMAAVGVVLAGLWVVVTTGWSSIPVAGIASLIMLGAMVGGIGYALLRPFWRLIDWRIIMAPDILVAIRERCVQLEAGKEPTEGGNHVRVIRLVRYSGDCPICGEKVHLQDGGREFPERLVGRCDEHPAEHVFSFDRHSRMGRPLR
ncbi:hypothetical protein VSR17_15365 [Cupriavidus taiwanensis]|uniref:hypothetical protein n=1 Tax=Cupriavidus taiwanensis TaxID=164546 RepID=UPI0031727B30